MAKNKIERGPRGPRGFRGFPGPVGPTGPKGESAADKVWKLKETIGRIEAEHVVDNAIKRMAEETTHKEIEPGLHVRRWREGPSGDFQYQLVKVISIDEGRGARLNVYALHGEYAVSLFDIERSDFQRINE